MNELVVPIYLIAIAGLLHVILEIVKIVQQVLHDAKTTKAMAEYQATMAHMSEVQENLSDGVERRHQEWRAVVEHETGKKFSDLTDAEILSIVRSESESPQ